MLIGIDMDEVLSSYLSAFLKYYNDKYKTSYERKDFHVYKFHDIIGMPLDQMINIIYDFIQTPYFDNMKPIRGSKKGIKALENHDLMIITSRQYDLIGKTNEWLDIHFPNISEIHFTNNYAIDGSKQIPKSEICKRQKVDLYIEDTIDYALECSRITKVLLLDKPWNQTDALPENIQRMYGWNHIIKEIT